MTNAAQKEIGLVIFALLFGAVGLAAYTMLLPAAIETWSYTVILVAIALLWLAVMLVTLSMCRRALSVIALTLLPATMAIVMSGFSAVVIGGALLLAVFTLLAQRTLLREEQNRLQYKTTQFFSSATRLLALGLMIMLTCLAWPVLTDSVKNTRFVISDQQVGPLLRPLEPIIRDFFPGYSSGASIDELIDATLAEERKKLPPGTVIDPLQEQQVRADMRARLGANLKGNESLATIVADRVNGSVNTLAAQNPVQASLILAVLALLTLRALLPLVVWPTLGLVALLVKIAVSSHLASITTQEVLMERLRL